jgi:hypothetical protein
MPYAIQDITSGEFYRGHLVGGTDKYGNGGYKFVSDLNDAFLFKSVDSAERVMPGDKNYYRVVSVTFQIKEEVYHKIL